MGGRGLRARLKERVSRRTPWDSEEAYCCDCLVSRCPLSCCSPCFGVDGAVDAPFPAPADLTNANSVPSTVRSALPRLRVVPVVYGTVRGTAAKEKPRRSGAEFNCRHSRDYLLELFG